VAALKQPLDPAAVTAADEAVYSRYASQPRPNALFDAAGNRLPLDASDPAQMGLRSEWRQAYEAALQQREADGGPASAGLQPAQARDAVCRPAKRQPGPSRAVADPVQPCPRTHWFEVQLTVLPDADARPAWWPARPAAIAGGFVAEVTSGRQEDTLGTDGKLRIDGIAAGRCGVHFAKLLDEVQQALESAR
jgi:hypothetical protein